MHLQKIEQKSSGRRFSFCELKYIHNYIQIDKISFEKLRAYTSAGWNYSSRWTKKNKLFFSN